MLKRNYCVYEISNMENYCVVFPVFERKTTVLLHRIFVGPFRPFFSGVSFVNISLR